MESHRFNLDRYGWLILLRLLPGAVAIPFALYGRFLVAGICLVLAVWADVLVGGLARRRGWPRRVEHREVEGLVDCCSFVVAPVFFVLIQCHVPLVLGAALLFLGCGIFRIARFNVEGLDVDGKYTGLPVTYNGYSLPLLAVASHFAGSEVAAPLFAGGLFLFSFLMVSRHVRIPEF